MIEIGLTALLIVQGDVSLEYLDSHLHKEAPDNKYAKPLVFITATGDDIIDDMVDLPPTTQSEGSDPLPVHRTFGFKVMLFGIQIPFLVLSSISSVERSSRPVYIACVFLQSLKTTSKVIAHHPSSFYSRLVRCLTRSRTSETTELPQIRFTLIVSGRLKANGIAICNPSTSGRTAYT